MIKTALYGRFLFGIGAVRPMEEWDQRPLFLNFVLVKL